MKDEVLDSGFRFKRPDLPPSTQTPILLSLPVQKSDDLLCVSASLREKTIPLV